MVNNEELQERKRILEEQLAEYSEDKSKFIMEWTQTHPFFPDIELRLKKELEKVNMEIESGE